MDRSELKKIVEAHGRWLRANERALADIRECAAREAAIR